MKFAFIAQHLEDQPLAVACEVLEVSRSGYYAWQHRPVSSQSRRRMELATKIQALHADNRGVYGSPRIFQALVAQGEPVCENTVAKVMRLQGLRARVKRKFVPRTTDSATANRSRPTCWIGSSRHRRPIVSGPATSRTFPRTRAGCTWPG